MKFTAIIALLILIGINNLTACATIQPAPNTPTDGYGGEGGQGGHGGHGGVGGAGGGR